MKKYESLELLIKAKGEAMHAANLENGGIFVGSSGYSNADDEMLAAAAKVRWANVYEAPFHKMPRIGWVIPGFGWA